MLSLFISAALAFTPSDAALAHRSMADFVAKCTPRDAGTGHGRTAAYWILDHASMTGADVKFDAFKAKTPRGEKTFINLYSEFSADVSESWVVLVSHYDTKPGVRCPGANDGASTTGLLVAMANVLREWKTPRGNVMLVWTDGEECMESYSQTDGLQGSRRAVEYLKHRGRTVRAVLCLDMLGDKDLSISIPVNSSAALAKLALWAARSIGEPNLVKQVGEVVKDDHVPFLEAGISAIDLIDFSYGPNNAWWHTPEDTCDKVSKDSLLKSGRLVCEMLNALL